MKVQEAIRVLQEVGNATDMHIRALKRYRKEGHWKEGNRFDLEDGIAISVSKLKMVERELCALEGIVEIPEKG